jgi:hypothetical protein
MVESAKRGRFPGPALHCSCCSPTGLRMVADGKTPTIRKTIFLAAACRPPWLEKIGGAGGSPPRRFTFKQEPTTALLPVNLVAKPPKLPADGPGRNPLVDGNHRIYDLLLGHPLAPGHRLGDHPREKAARGASPCFLAVDGDRTGGLGSAQNWNLSRFQDSVTHCRAAIPAAGLVHFLHQGLDFLRQQRVHSSLRDGRIAILRSVCPGMTAPSKGIDVWPESAVLRIHSTSERALQKRRTR